MQKLVRILTMLLLGGAVLGANLAGALGQTERRVALVIGNANYKSSPLRNPANDARALGQALRTYGFEVIRHENLTQKDMKRAIADFGERLTDSGVGLFYYAGHGAQVTGRNFMIPVDASINKESDVDPESVDVDAVLSRMDGAKNRMNIVILDACRDNPYSRSWRSAQRGLAQIQAGPGTLIAYATAPGKVAADGEGANGLYTGELLKVMGTTGLKIEDVFKQVRVSVQQQTKGAQVPWESSSLTADFYFVPGGRRTEVAAFSPLRSTSPDTARAPSAVEIERNIQRRLQEKGLAALTVEVTADGVVTLTGIVKSPGQKSLALEAAQVAGVRDVRSRINVQGNWKLSP